MATFVCTLWFLCVIFFTYKGTQRIWNYLTADKTSLLLTALFMVSSLVVGVILIPLLIISLFF